MSKCFPSCLALCSTALLGKALLHARALGLFRLRCPRVWESRWCFPLELPGLPVLPGYRKVAWQNQENQAPLGGIPTWIALGNSPDLTDLLQFRSVWN